MEDEQIRKVVNQIKETFPIERVIVRKIYEILFVIDSIKNVDYEQFQFIFNQEKRRGLLEGSLLQNPLFYPTKYENFEKLSPKGGLYATYEPFRKSFKYGRTMTDRGALASILPTWIEAQTEETWTTEIIDPLNLEYLQYFEKTTIERLLKQKLIRETNYKAAWKNIGGKNIEERIRKSEILGIAENTVYQVTPKGNGVIYLVNIGGEKEKLPKELPELSPVQA